MVAILIVAQLNSIAYGCAESADEKIVAAKAAYQIERAKLRDDVLGKLKKAEESVRKSGKKDLVDKIIAETSAFETYGTFPSVISTKSYHRQLKKSLTNVEDLYIQLIKDLTKAGMDDDANTLQLQLSEFRIAEKIFEGKLYAVNNTGMSWHEAGLACERQGGHLAIVDSEAESNFLIALLKAEGVATAFIGATDELREKRWIWVNRRNLVYSNWDVKHSQPNNNDGKGNPEHYAAILLEYGGKWWDVPVRAEGIGFICQWD